MAMTTLSNLRAELPPLIPRELLFGNPERTAPQLSPDGMRLAWLAPDTNNVLQVWVQALEKEAPAGKPVTADKRRGIRQYLWAKDNRTLLYMQDSDGDENWHVYGVDLPSGNVRDYTPFQDVRAELVDLNPDLPNEVLLSLNLRNRELNDVHRLNLKTGGLELETENPGDIVGWGVDPKFHVRFGVVSTPDGGTEIRVRESATSGWKSLIKVGPEEILQAHGFSGDGESLYLESSVGRNTSALLKKNIGTGKEDVLAEHSDVDVESVVINPKTYVAEAVSFSPGRRQWRVLDPAVSEDFVGLKKLFDGDFFVGNRTEADDIWLVGYDSDHAPGRYFKWDRKKREGSFLLTTRPKLDGLALAEMKAVVIAARDGLKMNSYLTLPVGIPAKDLPMVLVPHGGPWARDDWGFDGMAQWLANRGYAVLQPNFRGSTGFGKDHLNAGNKQWGLKMHDDLIDAVNWAINEGIADPKRVGILGGSYGGYCALAAVTFTPEVFACSVDIVGPSNIKTLINSIPPYWKPLRAVFDVRVGNVDEPKEEELIRRASPLQQANRIVRPLMIAQGANDPRVKQAESEQIVKAIENNDGSVIYVLYPDEGHGFARPENRIDFYARAERFLGEHLGGRVEPMQGDKIPGATAIVRVIGKK
jgi:dipeptidyl aminopeptidase/acylaminoacyl peptidase